MGYEPWSRAAPKSPQDNDNDGQSGSQPVPEDYDFVIVGGGTAGLTLANRLTEVSDWRVLVLEDGGSPASHEAYRIPARVPELLGSELDWGLATVAQIGLSSRTLPYPRGRCLGGSSSINLLTYTRGSKSIYDTWAALGNHGWDWEGVHPYFKESTSSVPTPLPSDPQTTGSGPVVIGPSRYSHPAGSTFVDATVSALGLRKANDVNSGINDGAMLQVYTLNEDSRRVSSHDAYLEPIQKRGNLIVKTSASVQRLVLEVDEQGQSKATGVVYVEQSSGRSVKVIARKEIILSAGAIHTPQLLMLSGIGAGPVLQKFKIDPIVVNDNIGQHMQDHIAVNAIAKSKPIDSSSQNGADPKDGTISPAYAFEQLTRAELESLGIGSLSTNQAHVEYLPETAFWPMVPMPFGLHQDENETYLSISAVLLSPFSRGSVTLRSSSVDDPPLIDPQYLNDARDVAFQKRNLEKLQLILKDKAFAPIMKDGGEVAPGVGIEGDDKLEEWIRATSWTLSHACGTCRMLPQSDGGVVDPRLRVYDVSNLRIVDASIFPVIPDAHPMAAVYMCAEKAADMIKEDWGENRG